MHHLSSHHGVIVPMVTPVTPDGSLDEPAVRRIVDHLVAGGVHGIFVLGTTGENTSVPLAMRERLVAATVEHVAGRVRTYAGISSNCLADSVAAARAYVPLGVDAVVAHLPMYYALNAEEQFTYFNALAERIDLPLVLYDIPVTTHMAIPVDAEKGVRVAHGLECVDGDGEAAIGPVLEAHRTGQTAGHHAVGL